MVRSVLGVVIGVTILSYLWAEKVIFLNGNYIPCGNFFARESATQIVEGDAAAIEKTSMIASAALANPVR
jgi:hypothetical protein